MRRSVPSGPSGRWRATPLAALAWLVLVTIPRSSPGQAQLPIPAGDKPGAAIDDPSFGAVLIIEDIEIEGNEWTADRVILRLLPIRRGYVLRAGDPRFQKARFKLLATGYFRAVELVPRRGSRRGHVILTVRVKERGTVVLNSLYFGTSVASPWWAGLDITERNFYGTGLGVGLGGVYAGKGDIPGADDQWAVTLRLAASSILGTEYGAHVGVLHTRASDPFRVRGDPSDDTAANFRAVPYSRLGFESGVSVDLSPLTHISFDARAEWVDADPPAAPTRELPDGTFAPVDIGLLPGSSRVVTLAFGLDRDTRTDPILPSTGDRLVVLGELGTTWIGGSYDFALGLARYERWWTIRPERHVFSVHLTGGLVLGEAPRFDRLHVSDFNRLLTPRAFGMVLSTTPSQDFLGTGSEDTDFGDIGASVVVEYSYQLFRERFYVYGGDLFVGTGLWMLSRLDQLGVRDTSLRRAIPIDLIVDAGLRIDTAIGIFELTFANALGRVPL